jgi:hypothetical protein
LNICHRFSLRFWDEEECEQNSQKAASGENPKGWTWTYDLRNGSKAQSYDEREKPVVGTSEW